MAQQRIEAVAPDVVAERIIRGRDGIFGADQRLAGMGLEQLRIAPHAPWRNAFAESGRVSGGLHHRYSRAA
jgi:hypothetical protein